MIYANDLHFYERLFVIFHIFMNDFCIKLHTFMNDFGPCCLQSWGLYHGRAVMRR